MILWELHCDLEWVGCFMAIEDKFIPKDRCAIISDRISEVSPGLNPFNSELNVLCRSSTLSVPTQESHKQEQSPSRRYRQYAVMFL
jgi:hypothetical protein